MLEYFTFKKAKKAQTEEKEKGKAEVQVQEQEPILSPEDENFLGRIISAEGTPPPLPDRPSFLEDREVGDSTGNQGQMVIFEGKEDADVDTRKKSESSERKKSGSSDRRKSVSSNRKSVSSHRKLSTSNDRGKSVKKVKEKKEKDKKGGVFSFLQKKVSAITSFNITR